MNPGAGYSYDCRSLEEVLNDPAYEFVAQWIGDRYSYSQPNVVRHKATGTLWASVMEGPTRWWEVEARVEVIERTTYVPKKRTT